MLVRRKDVVGGGRFSQKEDAFKRERSRRRDVDAEEGC